jgi:Cyclin, N-terminal domain
MMTTTTLDIWLLQEQEYMASDYLGRSTSSALSSSGVVVDVDTECRVKMAEWFDQCIDFCKFDREVVEITLNYLDRFASTTTIGQSSILTDRGEYQLAAMTALYTAIKIHQPQAVSSRSISLLSRERYTKEDIERMELRMITALGWKMNPVTVSAFVRAILDQIQEDTTALGTIDQKSLYRLAKIQTDVAVRDYAFCTIRPSVIAYSAIMNALEALGHSASVEQSFLHTFLKQRLGLTTSNGLEGVVRKYLYTSIANETTVRPNATSTSLASSPSVRRRPPTPAPDCEQESGSFKLRRIASTDSPRSSMEVQR